MNPNLEDEIQDEEVVFFNQLTSPLNNTLLVDLAETTRLVLADAQQTGIKTVMCASISESALIYIAALYIPYKAVFDITRNLLIRVVGSIRDIKIDIANRRFLLIGELRLDVGSKIGGGFASRITVDLEVSATPVLAQSAISALQLQFEECRIVNPPEITVLDWDTLKDDFANDEEFVRFIESIIQQITIPTAPPYNLVLPTFLARMPLPDHWEHIEEYRLNFLKMDYRAVVAPNQGIDNNLFLVFGVQSLSLPVPCICSEPPPGESRQLLSDLELNDIRPLMAVGLSEDALNEIAKPHVNTAYTNTYQKGGVLFALARYWIKSTLKKVRVTSTSLQGEIDSEGGGEVKAGVTDKCGKQLSASTKMTLFISDVVVNWQVLEKSQSLQNQDEMRLSVELNCSPTVDVGRIDAVFDSNTFPLDQILSYVLSHLADLGRKELEKALERVLSYILFRSSSYDRHGGFVAVSKLDVRFFEGQAMVILLAPRIVNARRQ